MLPRQTRRVYSVTPHAVGITVDKQVKAKRVSMRSEHIKHSAETGLERGKENGQKKKEAKEKGSWAQLKCQPESTL